MTLDRICDRLFEAKRIAIFTHISPDCDGVGAMFALHYGLTSLGKKCSMFVDGELDKYERQIFDMNKVNKTDLLPEKFDTFIAVDCADSKRLGKYKEAFLQFDNTYKIDHHIRVEDYAKYSYIEHDSAACCEIIYELLQKLQVHFDKKLATYLYAGIATDTNSFMNTNTTARSYKIASKLCEKNADTILVNTKCFRTVSKESIQLMKVFYNKIKIINGNFAYVILNKKDFAKTKTSHLETSNFSNLLLSVEGMQVGCCITEREDVFSLSIRTKLGVNANAFAQLFGGGGHTQASGAKVQGKEKAVERQLLTAVKQFFKEEK